MAPKFSHHNPPPNFVCLRLLPPCCSFAARSSRPVLESLNTQQFLNLTRRQLNPVFVSRRTGVAPGPKLDLNLFSFRHVEVLQLKETCPTGHTAAVDWWTLGILIYEMIARNCYATTPFKGAERNNTFANIRDNPVHSKDTPNVSPAGKDCVTLLDKRRERGWEHKWVAKINWGLLRNQLPPIIPTMSFWENLHQIYWQGKESESLALSTLLHDIGDHIKELEDAVTHTEGDDKSESSHPLPQRLSSINFATLLPRSHSALIPAQSSLPQCNGGGRSG
ncbi:hypothetical protein R3P38DRAFT_3203253 [Favolaschia claudopus]|uniref:non-specific serine/threonine protein kinase n=1 Tax=Favolaschia claudopus TaxID=2862362 RepID=A0AAW0ASZ0_9AGAR